MTGLRLGWLHIPKAGSSFGTALGHYLAPNLPATACVPDCRAERCGRYGHGNPESSFWDTHVRAVLPADARVWLKTNHKSWGDHTPLYDTQLAAFSGHIFGFFRDPRDRVASAYNHFGAEWRAYRRNASTATHKMGRNASFYARHAVAQVLQLSGGRYGLACLSPRHSSAPAGQRPIVSTYPKTPSSLRGCPPRDDALMAHTRKAILRLRAFAFVGVTHEWWRSICLFHLMHGGSCLPAELSNSRPGKYRARGQRNDTPAAAEPYDVYDERLWAAVLERVWNDVREHNATDGRCTRLCGQKNATLGRGCVAAARTQSRGRR
jgi:hypothetical protein